MLLQILAACPIPARPQWTMRLPIASRIGFARAKGSSAPPHLNVRVSAPPPPTPDPSRPRRVEGERSGRSARFVSALGALHVDGRAVDNEGPARRGGQEI